MGPKLFAATGPTKKSPRTDDWNRVERMGVFSTQAISDRSGLVEELEAVNVDPIASPGHHVVDIGLLRRSVSSAQSKADAATLQCGVSISTAAANGNSAVDLLLHHEGCERPKMFFDDQEAQRRGPHMK